MHESLTLFWMWKMEVEVSSFSVVGLKGQSTSGRWTKSRVFLKCRYSSNFYLGSLKGPPTFAHWGRDEYFAQKFRLLMSQKLSASFDWCLCGSVRVSWTESVSVSEPYVVIQSLIISVFQFFRVSRFSASQFTESQNLRVSAYQSLSTYLIFFGQKNEFCPSVVH